MLKKKKPTWGNNLNVAQIHRKTAGLAIQVTMDIKMEVKLQFTGSCLDSTILEQTFKLLQEKMVIQYSKAE